MTKCQISAVVVTTIASEFFLVKLLFQGKTEQCHPIVKPQKDGIFGTVIITVDTYISNVTMPFVNKKREERLQLQPTLTIINNYKG